MSQSRFSIKCNRPDFQAAEKISMLLTPSSCFHLVDTCNFVYSICIHLYLKNYLVVFRKHHKPNVEHQLRPTLMVCLILLHLYLCELLSYISKSCWFSGYCWQPFCISLSKLGWVFETLFLCATPFSQSKMITYVVIRFLFARRFWKYKRLNMQNNHVLFF